jgi:hypothetical protein
MRLAIYLGIALAVVPALHAETALDAIKLLPKDQAARIARIEGRDGAPDPDRWYILTQDPAAENGLHEYVVSDGKIVASRSLSQFAEALTPADVVGAAPVKIDSDAMAKLARHYADANGSAVSTLNYELKRAGPGGAPAWTVSCVDSTGTTVGELVVAASAGTVVSHDGFTVVPEAEATPADTPEKEESHAAPARDEETAPESGTARERERERAETVTVRASPSPKKRSAVAKTMTDVGRTLHKFLPF